MEDYLWQVWYDHPLREDVRLMCRAIIEARIQGINPLELGDRVNEVVLINLQGNPGMRHTDFTYQRVTDIIHTAIELGRVKPTLPPMEIVPQNINVFTPQREVMVNALAQEWYQRVGKE